MSDKTECVKVVIRCRPLRPKEKEDKQKKKIIVQINQSIGQIVVHNPFPQKNSLEPFKTFTFDYVYGLESKQQTIFKQSAQPIVASALEGFNGTIFAYGQTGTGKTFTMDGPNGEFDQIPADLKGIVPRTIDYIFDTIKKAAQNKKYLVRVSFLQLYNEQLIDLLLKQSKQVNPQQKKKKLQIHQKPDVGIYVNNLSNIVVNDKYQLTQRLEFGKKNRKHAETEMNQRSSRSHSCFIITIENSEVRDEHQHFRVGKLNLVDLAGSQRQDKTKTTGQQFKNAININLSLTTLGYVIHALVNPKQKFVPYRDSKLTRLLQDSLGGNTKTVMIANIGPSAFNYDQTVNSLRYANNAKSIKNKPVINQDPKDALLRQFQQQIQKLKAQLALQVGEGGVIHGKTQIIQKIKMVNEGGQVVDIEQKLAQQKQKIKRKNQQEKRRIIAQKNLQEEEKNRLLNQLTEKEKEAQELKEKQQKMLKKLKKMEEKVIHGTQQVQKAAAKQKEFQTAQKLLKKQKEEQERLQREIQEKEELEGNFKIKYQSQKEQIEDKSRRIKGLKQKLRKLQVQNQQLDQIYTKQIEQLQERRGQLCKQLKLKHLILQYFVPQKQIQRLQLRAVFNQQIDDWMYPNLELAGNILKGEKKVKPQLNELDEQTKLQLQTHPNVYYVLTEQGPIREQQLAPDQRKKKKKKKKKKL